jgi:hypothetical protein
MSGGLLERRLDVGMVEMHYDYMLEHLDEMTASMVMFSVDHLEDNAEVFVDHLADSPTFVENGLAKPPASSMQSEAQVQVAVPVGDHGAILPESPCVLHDWHAVCYQKSPGSEEKGCANLDSIILAEYPLDFLSIEEAAHECAAACTTSRYSETGAEIEGGCVGFGLLEDQYLVPHCLLYRDRCVGPAPANPAVLGQYEFTMKDASMGALLVFLMSLPVLMVCCPCCCFLICCYCCCCRGNKQETVIIHHHHHDKIKEVKEKVPKKKSAAPAKSNEPSNAVAPSNGEAPANGEKHTLKGVATAVVAANKTSPKGETPAQPAKRGIKKGASKGWFGGLCMGATPREGGYQEMGAVLASGGDLAYEEEDGYEEEEEDGEGADGAAGLNV